MLNALLIANARSGAADRLGHVKTSGRWVRDPAEVTPAVVAGTDLLAFFAGDGTLQITLSQLLRELPVAALPPIALLPFGTTNMNAKDLNRSRRRRRAVASLDRAIRTGVFERTHRPLLRIDDTGQVSHGFFFGLGIIAEVVARWNAERGRGAVFNQLRTLRAMSKGLSGVSSVSEIELEGEPRSVYGLLATTLDRLLFGSRPFWGDGHPGDLRVTWVEGRARHLLRHAPALLRGRDRMAGVPGYESRTVEALELKLTGPYIIDGEIFHPRAQSLKIERSEPLTWIVL